MLDHMAGEQTPPSFLASEATLAAARSEREEQLLFVAALRDALARHNIHMPVPLPTEHVYLLRGMPVVPWIPLRAAEVVWSAWLDRLQALWCGWTQVAGGTFVDWPAWRDEHVHLLHAQHTRLGVEALAQELAQQQLAGAGVHLVGHSVGGASALAYLAHLRAGIVEQPRARLRSVITLDAAVFGIAGVWTGTRQTLRAGASRAFKGMGAWSAQHGIGILTACNERDMWSHRAIADLPYVGMRLGPRHGTLSQIDGRIHGLLRRTPELVEAIWTPAQELLPAGAGPLPPASGAPLAW